VGNSIDVEVVDDDPEVELLSCAESSSSSSEIYGEELSS